MRFERAREEHAAVGPVSDIVRGDQRAREQQDAGRADREPRMRRSWMHLARAPRDHHAQADHRQVHVAVGHRLVADLDEPDDRHEHADEPEPADCEVRLACATCRTDRRGDDEQQRRRADDGRHRPGLEQRIERREIARPEEFAEVAGVGDERVADAA